MPAKVFLDTNILVYCFDQAASKKRATARSIIQDTENWVISWQVVQEFCNVALHRFAQPMQVEDLQDYCELILMPNCQVMPTQELYKQALSLQAHSQYRFYDSLVVASALACGANTLYSEDLQAGRKFGDLEIVNPLPTQLAD